MKFQRSIRLFFVLAMMVVGLIITIGYWQTEQFSAIKQVSVFTMSLVMIYIGLHFIKRLLFKEVMWWDWLYYLALVSIMAPVLFADSTNENLYHWMIDLGSTFFIVPLLFDLKEWAKPAQKEEL